MTPVFGSGNPLPGIEITTDKGHFNLFGIKDMPEKLLEIVDVFPRFPAVFVSEY